MSASTSPATSVKYVIFDCDGGSDDAWALLLLLRAEQEQRLKLLGITICGCGNTNLQNAACNMLRVLKESGRDEIPIFFGASEALLPTASAPGATATAEAHCGCKKLVKFHGHDGFGDVLGSSGQEDIDIDEMVEHEHAVAAIHQFCLEHPKEVTIVTVGPLTNIALCFSMYGKDFGENVKELYIMGGNHQGVGNHTRSAEFNFYADPEAAHIVFGKAQCPITLLPWEPCLESRFYVSLSWRLDEFGKEAANVPVIDLLNKVERAQYTAFESKVWNPCDAMLVAGFLFGSHFVRRESKFHVTVDLMGHTRGQCVLDHLHEVEKYPKNVRIIELVDADFFKRVTQWAVGFTDLSLELSNGNQNE